jgi:hypothetical protein
MNTFKSVGAVFAGFVTVVILSMGTDFALESLGIFPPLSDPGLYITWMLLLALAYRCVYTAAGGYVTAVLAPSRPMRHVIILGIFGLAGGAAGVIVGWNMSHHWYPIAILISAFPCTWLGGRLKTKKSTDDK